MPPEPLPREAGGDGADVCTGTRSFTDHRNSLKERRAGRAGIAAGRIGGAHRGNPVGAIDDRAADAGAAKAC